MKFAWKSFLYKAFEFLRQQLPEPPTEESSEMSDAGTRSVCELRRQLWASTDTAEGDDGKTIPDSWANR